MQQEITKGNQDSKSKETQLDKKIATLTQTVENNQKNLTDKITEVDKKLVENQSKIEKDKVASQTEGKKTDAELDKKITTLTQIVENNQKSLSDKIAEVDKKLGENQSKIEKDKVASQTEGKNKETELLTKINKLTEDVDAKNKTSTTKLE